MREEIEVIQNELSDVEIKEINHITFYIGYWHNHHIVLVQSGIGKVNAAATATMLINHFPLRSLFFSGVAGAVDESLNIGDIVISRDLIQYDMDLTAFGYRKWQLPQTSQQEIPISFNLLALAESAFSTDEHIHIGRIISGDQFISKKEEKIRLGKEFDALCVDMESAAVAQVCQIFQIECLIIRSISDSVTEESKMEYEKFLPLAAENSKQCLETMLQALCK